VSKDDQMKIVVNRNAAGGDSVLPLFNTSDNNILVLVAMHKQHKCSPDTAHCLNRHKSDYVCCLLRTCTSWVAWVHGDEGHDTGPQPNLHIFKHEALLAASQRIKHRLVLRAAAWKSTAASRIHTSAAPTASELVASQQGTAHVMAEILTDM
jgi:hypothetical protein